MVGNEIAPPRHFSGCLKYATDNVVVVVIFAVVVAVADVIIHLAAFSYISKRAFQLNYEKVCFGSYNTDDAKSSYKNRKP